MTRFKVFASLLLVVAGLAATVPATASAGDGSVAKDLATAYRSTARFHRVEVAEAAGYELATECLTFPDGYLHFPPGTMGTHYINFDYFDDGGSLDPATPEALVYEPQADGGLRLTAVEYIIPEAELPRTAPPPVMFGREMMFHPMFEVWALHVWLWQYNPYGLFADVNPRVDCDAATSR